ncbi:MAG: hypothetical protein ACTSPB_07335 [Candidatus Thorarchaeota archaeon]
MYFKDLPTKDLLWLRELKHKYSTIEDDINDAIVFAEDIPEFKSRIIHSMTEMMIECAQVIQHVNAMKTPKKCTCAQNRGDES